MTTPDRTAAKRQKSRRQRVIDSGGRQLGLLIPPEVNAALAAEIARTGETATAAALRLLAQALAVTK